MDLKVKKKYVVASRITNYIRIEIKKGVTLELEKWSSEGDYEYETDYEFKEDSKKIFDKLPEEEQDEVTEFIFDI